MPGMVCHPVELPVSDLTIFLLQGGGLMGGMVCTFHDNASA